MSDSISKEDLVEGKAYLVQARNFDVAIWTGKAFAGLRYKFGDRFIDEELLYEDSDRHGTVKVIRELK